MSRRLIFGISFVVICILSAGNVFAVADTGWCQITEVSNQYDSGVGYVTLDCTPVNDGCTYGGQYGYAIYSSSDSNEYKYKMALIMAAYLGGKPVNLHLDGCIYDGHTRVRMVRAQP